MGKGKGERAKGKGQRAKGQGERPNWKGERGKEKGKGGKVKGVKNVLCKLYSNTRLVSLYKSYKSLFFVQKYELLIFRPKKLQSVTFSYEK